MKVKASVNLEDEFLATEKALDSLSAFPTKVKVRGKPNLLVDEEAEPVDDEFAELERQVNEMSGDEGNAKDADDDYVDPDEPKDANGVPQTVLMEEEELYHKHELIRSVDALQHEIEMVFKPIIENKLVGPDYQDFIQTTLVSVATFANRISKGIENKNLTISDYLAMVESTLQEHLLLLGGSKKTMSVTAKHRIGERAKIMIKEVVILRKVNDTSSQVTEAEVQQEFALKVVFI